MNTLAFTLTIPLDTPLNVLRISLLMFIYTALVAIGGDGMKSRSDTAYWLGVCPLLLLGGTILISALLVLIP